MNSNTHPMDEWRDKYKACLECGCIFYPEEGDQDTCNDCILVQDSFLYDEDFNTDLEDE